MPTTVYVDVTSSGNNTDAGGYTTLSQACTDYSDATHGKDLVAADVLLVFRVHDDFGGYLNEGSTGANFGTAGYTTDSTRYIIVDAAPGDECTFTESSGARIQITSKFGQTVETINTTKVEVKNLVLKEAAGLITGGEGSHIAHKFTNCMCLTERGATDDKGLVAIRNFPGETDSDKFIGSMAVRLGGNAEKNLITGASNFTTTIQGSVFIGGYVDAGTSYGAFNISDSVIYNPGNSTFVDTSSPPKSITADNNAFSDAVGVGTNKQLSIGTDQFTNYAGGDYTTAAGSTMQTNGIGIILNVPTITVDQANLAPGGTISGAYTNFASTPTSPAVLTDSNSNTINVTVTVTGTSSTGTFTGTMPSLPTTGNTSNFLLFGTVSVALD